MKENIYPYKSFKYSAKQYLINKNKEEIQFEQGRKSTYDQIFAFEGELAIVKSGSWYGVINKLGDEIISPFSTMQIAEKPQIKNNLILASEYDLNREHSSNGANNQYFGVIDYIGNVIIPFECNTIHIYEHDFIKVKSIYIDNFVSKVIITLRDYTGEIIISPEIIGFNYDDLEFAGNNLCRVLKGDKWSYVDVTNKQIVIQFLYTYAGDFKLGLAPVSKQTGFDISHDRNYQCGFIDNRGNEIIPLNHSVCWGEAPERLANELIAFSIDSYDEKWILYNKNGKCITPENCYFRYEDFRFIDTSSNSCLIAFKNNISDLVGYVDLNGNDVIPAQFKLGSEFNNGFAIVTTDAEECRLINHKGELLGKVISKLWPYNYLYHDHIVNLVAKNVEFEIQATSHENLFFKCEIIYIDKVDHLYNSRDCSNPRYKTKIGIIDVNNREIVPVKYFAIQFLRSSELLIVDLPNFSGELVKLRC